MAAPVVRPVWAAMVVRVRPGQMAITAIPPVLLARMVASVAMVVPAVPAV